MIRLYKEPRLNKRFFKFLDIAFNHHRSIQGDGFFTKLCNRWLEDNLYVRRAFVTHSGTGALEMASIVCDVGQGDEVIVPSFTFCSTANAFALRGATIVFVDVKLENGLIDEKLIPDAITDKTKVIVPVHYCGNACRMDQIVEIAKEREIYVVEDSAQAFCSGYENGIFLGTIGDIGIVSFHEHKIISCGDGGAIFINNENLIERAERVYNYGTDRFAVLQGKKRDYAWESLGSMYMMDELTASYLYSLLYEYDPESDERDRLWRIYESHLTSLDNLGYIRLPLVEYEYQFNPTHFYFFVNDTRYRDRLIEYLRKHGIESSAHFRTLHDSDMGKRLGRCGSEIKNAKIVADSIVRLPLYEGLSEYVIEYICETVERFFCKGDGF